MGRRLIRHAITLAVVYIAGYLAFRMMQQEVWAGDGKTYVIFPDGTQVLYYLWRPLMYLDGALTGMAFHLGPH
jgi:hypothetical protein